MELRAEENTWIKQRRIRREQLQDLPTSTAKIHKQSDISEKTTEDIIHDRESKSDREQNKYSQMKRPAEHDSNCGLLKKAKTETVDSSMTFKVDPVLIASLVVHSSESDMSVVELCWLGGVGGKDLAHQLIQYLKNKLS